MFCDLAVFGAILFQDNFILGIVRIFACCVVAPFADGTLELEQYSLRFGHV